MKNVLVIGAGNMGSALTRALATQGNHVAVWNRTPEKARALADVARPAQDLFSAVSEADLIVVSVSDYAACGEIIYTGEFAQAVGDATIVQLTSGSPEDARRSQAWAQSLGVDYLDAAILAYPSFVGTEYATVFYSGSKAGFDRHEETLKAFSNAPVFAGEAVGAASALDCAILQAYYGGCLAFLHAAALCEAEGIPGTAFLDYKAAFVGLIDITADAAREMMDQQDFSGVQCSLDTHVAALKNIVRMSEDSGVAPEVPRAIHQAYQDTVASGRGGLELPALYEFFRRTN